LGDKQSSLEVASPAECLQAIADVVVRARTLRIRFHHESIHQFRKHGLYQTHSEGVLLLGEAGKLNLTADSGRGGPYRLVSNGTDLWEDTYLKFPGIQKQIKGSTTVPDLMAGIRTALAYGTILRPAFTYQYEKPDCCMWPERRLTMAPPADVTFLGNERNALSYSFRTVYADNSPKIFRATLWYDPVTLAIKKRSLSLAAHGADPEFTITEVYDEFVLNTEIPEDAFKVPPEPTDMDKTQQRLAAIREALDGYLIDNRAYPTTDQGLEALLRKPTNPPASNWKGSYVKDSESLRDAWGSPFIYRSPRRGINTKGYDLSSSGPDRNADTPDDVQR